MLCCSPRLSESPATLESSLSSAELASFQGCVIPPLTPQQDFTSEESLVNSSTEAENLSAQDRDLWQGIAPSHGRTLGNSLVLNKQVNLYDLRTVSSSPFS